MRTYIEYLPGFLRLIKDYQGIGDAVDPEVNNLVELQQQLEKNAVILDADSAIIRRWEHILRIIPATGDDLTLRRFRVATRLNSKLPYTERQMHASLQALVGDGYTASLSISDERLTIRIDLGRKDMLAEVARMLDEMVPLNIVLDVSILYNTHRMLQPYTHAQLAQKTHYAIRTEEINA